MAKMLMDIQLMHVTSELEFLHDTFLSIIWQIILYIDFIYIYDTAKENVEPNTMST